MKRKHFFKTTKVIERTTNRREYKILTTVDQDPYPEEYGSYMKRKPGRRGWRKSRLIWGHQIRMYKTWKHSRKHQWKIE